MANTNQFIKRIQDSDERVKRFWIGVFSGTTMLLVLLLWGAYGALTAAPREVAVAPSPTPNVSVAAASKSEATSRLALLGEALREGVKGIGQLFNRDYNFKISSSDKNFIYDELPPVPLTALP